MKNLMKIVAAFLAFTLFCTFMVLLFDGISEGVTDFTSKLLSISIMSILPIISISLSCFCLERGDNSILLRLITIYMISSVVLCGLIVFFVDSPYSISSLTNLDLSSSSYSSSSAEGFGEFLLKVYDFISKTHISVTLVSLVMMVEANNAVSSIVKKIAYGAIIANILLSGWIEIKQQFLESASSKNLYSSYSSMASMESFIFILKAYILSMVFEAFSVVLLFITNYAFSSSTEFVASDIDYEELKKEANKYSNTQINSIYNSNANKQLYTNNEQPKEIVKDASQTGIMNINNQLGNNSNVGQVQEAAKKTNVQVNTSDIGMPFSTGPVINQNINENTNNQGVVPQVQSQSQEQAQHTTQEVQQQVQEPVHQDVNEIMSNQMQQTQVAPQQTSEQNQNFNQ